MAKSESDIFTPRTGQVIQAENGTQYFVCGNNRIKISEHFAAGGKPLGDLIVDVGQEKWPVNLSATTIRPTNRYF